MSYSPPTLCSFLFFFNDTATTEIYTLSLHDALPISSSPLSAQSWHPQVIQAMLLELRHRSEEHTSELQSPNNLVCRLLLETKQSRRKLLTGTIVAGSALTHEPTHSQA